MTTGGNTESKDKPAKETTTNDNTSTTNESENMEPKVYDITPKGLDLADRKMSIRLVSVGDSRCPEGTSCITAGKAAVVLAIKKDGKESMLALTAKGLCKGDEGNCGSKGVQDGITIQLLNVYPPRTDPQKQIDQADFIARVKL